MDELDRPHGVGEPRAVAAGLGAIREHPVARIVLRDRAVFQPPRLVELMARGAADRAIPPGPERPIDELREGVPRRRPSRT
jgi:hypothetical protein